MVGDWRRITGAMTKVPGSERDGKAGTHEGPSNVPAS